MRTSALRVIALVMLPGLASAASYTPLGTLGNAVDATATGLSADGSVVVGHSGTRAFRWTAASGMTQLPSVPHDGSSIGDHAYGISGDGNVIVGQADDPYIKAVRWVGTSAPELLDPTTQGGPSANTVTTGGYSASFDGSVIVGELGGAPVWTATDGLLRSVPMARAYDVSDDGRVIVGETYGSLEAAMWSATTGLVPLGFPSIGYPYSRATGVSADGSVVVGWAGGGNGYGAFRWTAATGPVRLSAVDAEFGYEYPAISGDGRVIVGSGVKGTQSGAAFWTEENGLQILFDVLVSQGATGLDGWTLDHATGVSADGRTIVGMAHYTGNSQPQAFVAQLNPIPLPPSVWLFGSALGLMGRMRRKLPN